jgi:circadian clock protein KaiC
VLANEEVGGRHRRGLYVLKSRGMAHSNELREFVLTDRGLTLLDPTGEPGEPSDRLADGSLEGRDRHAVV